MADINMIQDNYVRLHNMTTEEVCKDCEIIRQQKAHAFLY